MEDRPGKATLLPSELPQQRGRRCTSHGAGTKRSLTTRIKEELSRSCKGISIGHKAGEPGGSFSKRLEPIMQSAEDEQFRSGVYTGDVTKSPTLTKQFQQFSIRDFFDKQGQRKYQNVSMSFAAKQHPDICFGSTIENAGDQGAGKQKLSARAYRLATEMIQRDKDAIHRQNHEMFQNLAHTERCHLQDVHGRQAEMLFLEVPDHMQFLPPGYELERQLPLDICKHEEREFRKRFDKANIFLMDSKNQKVVAKQGWLLPRKDVMELVQVAGSWMVAAGLSFQAGLDRATFCRFILDFEIADQEFVPYLWAIEAFDKLAKPIRVPPFNDEWFDPQDTKIPFLAVLSKWDFAVLVDMFLKRKYTNANKLTFIEQFQRRSRERVAEWEVREREEQEAHQEANRELARSKRQMQEAMGEHWKPPPQSANDDKGMTRCTRRRRNRLITGQLVEPDVLKVIESHRWIFEELFSSYQDDPLEPTMSFASLLQFCQDFRMVPRFASTHDVLWAFRSAECLDPPKASEEKKPRQRRGSTAASISRAEKEDLKPRFGVSAFVETVCRVAFMYLAGYGNAVQVAVSSRARMLWLIAYLHSVYAHLRESKAKRLTGLEDGTPAPVRKGAAAHSSRLDIALERMDPSWFKEPPDFKLQMDRDEPGGECISGMSKAYVEPSRFRRGTIAAIDRDNFSMASSNLVPTRSQRAGTRAMEPGPLMPKTEREMEEEETTVCILGSVAMDAPLNDGFRFDELLLAQLLVSDSAQPEAPTRQPEAAKRRRPVEHHEDLNAWTGGPLGMLDRSQLTPPPMNDFAEGLKKKLEKMISKGAEGGQAGMD